MADTLFITGIAIDRSKIAGDSGYPFSLPVVRHFNGITINEAVTFFIGENGSGKSTLLEAVAVSFGFNAEGGSRNFNFSTMDSHSGLYRRIKLRRGLRRPRDGYFLRAETFYNVATEIEKLDELPDFGSSPPIKDSYGGRSLHEQSHGESFFSLLANRFYGDGLYILDEPEAALSPLRQMSFLTRMHELVRAGSQFIVATHSPIILAYPGAKIYAINENGISETQYKETEQYKLTKKFLDNPERMVKILLE